MVNRSARHRSGFRLGTIGLSSILDHTAEELQELRNAPDDPSEMADILATLIHYSIMQGWTEDFLEKLMIEKLDVRFE